MNTYKAFYKGKTVLVQATTSYQAQLSAAALMKAKKHYDVTVMLVAKENKPVTHPTNEI